MDAYIAEHAVLVNPLVGEGYPSIGCAPCTAKPDAGRRPPQRPLGGVHQDRVRAARMTTDATPRPVGTDQLAALESEAIHIIREVAGEFDRPVILFSGGKDSMLLVHLARKAFWPAPVPFPVLHVDTGHNFPEVIDFRDAHRRAARPAPEVARVQDYIDDGRLSERPDGTRNPLQTMPLLDAIAEHRFDAVFGGGRRDEEKARAKERVFSPARRVRRLGPQPAAPGAVEPLQRAAQARASTSACSRCPTGPSSTSGSTSPARGSSCRRSTTPTARGVRARRHVAHQRPLGRPRSRRERRHGDRPLPHRRRRDPAPAPSSRSATTLDEVIDEVRASRLTERGATRADDRLSEAAMEDRKEEGYF